MVKKGLGLFNHMSLSGLKKSRYGGFKEKRTFFQRQCEFEVVSRRAQGRLVGPAAACSREAADVGSGRICGA